VVDSSAGSGSGDGRAREDADEKGPGPARDPGDRGEESSWVGAVGSRADRVARSAVRTGRGDRRGAAYQGAFEAVFAILIGTGLGYWADESFGTGPRYLIIGAIVGFAAFVLRLLRLGKQLGNEDGAGDDDSEPAP